MLEVKTPKRYQSFDDSCSKEISARKNSMQQAAQNELLVVKNGCEKVDQRLNRSLDLPK